MAIPSVAEKVKIEVRGELWIDPLDFLPSAARKTALLEGAKLNCIDLTMRDVDVVVKETAPRAFLEIFTNELDSALNRSKPSLCNPLLNKKASREQMYPNSGHSFTKENTCEDHPPFHVAIKVEDCSLDSERNNCQKGQSSSKCVFEESSAEETSITCISTLPEACSNNLSSKDMLEDNVGSPKAHNTTSSHLYSPEVTEKDAGISEIPQSLNHSIHDSMWASGRLDSLENHKAVSAKVKTETCEDEIMDGDSVSSIYYLSNSPPSAVKDEPLEVIGAPSIYETDNGKSTPNVQTALNALYFKVCENAQMYKGSSVDRISDCTDDDLSKNPNSYSAKAASSTSDIGEILPKREVDEDPLDLLDFMPLSERIRLLNGATLHDFEPAGMSKSYKKTHAKECDSEEYEWRAPPRKRKKTATDSVEVALEEDAPGLLQGLIESGINLDELKLYGCEEHADLIECASAGNGFENFEDVMYKIFSERPGNSLLNLNLPRSSKGKKAMYCLACLVSLIEQVRYLHFRKSPVEWGWCRDLQSFIFVFRMHNRIVLERPEYGYATYFFELLSSHPIEWQIKRLVIVMKLANFCRITLVENNPLMVGEDVSEGEARVLEEYGWRRNSGLGSMLSYCDRVVHDRIQERKISDWRLRIGKLLMAGYEGGRVVHFDNTQPLSPINVKLES